MALHRAPELDGFPALLYRENPEKIKTPVVICNATNKTGGLPKTIKRIHPITIPKPNRPLALFSSEIKVSKSVIRYRMKKTAAPIYKRDRGTHVPLLDINGKFRRTLCQSEDVYIISFDASGAFDNAPHFRLMRTPSEMGASASICSFLLNLLGKRTFQVRTKTNDGRLL